MSLSMIAAMSLIALATPPPSETVTHSVQVDHRGTAHAVTYRGTVDVAHKTIGMSSALGRAGSQRCLWTGTVQVERHIARADGGLTHTRPVARGPLLNGTRPGDCRIAAAGIEREVAARKADVHAHVLAVAERDHADLRAELDHHDRLAAN